MRFRPEKKTPVITTCAAQSIRPLCLILDIDIDVGVWSEVLLQDDGHIVHHADQPHLVPSPDCCT